MLHEIEELEEKMIASVAPKRKMATSKKSSSKSVEIVSELAENSKLLDEMEKGAVVNPRILNCLKLTFYKKHQKQLRKINEAEIDQKDR